QPAHLTARRRVVLQKPLRETRHPERQTPHPERPPVLHEDQLDAATADVDQEIGPALEAQRMARGAEDQAGLLGAGDDAHTDPGFAPESLHERAAVARL